MLGFPGWAMILEHLGTFVLNVGTIGLVPLLTYAWLMGATRLGRPHRRRGSNRRERVCTAWRVTVCREMSGGGREP